MTERILTADDVDRLGQALLTLTQELWVLRDRQMVLEAALAEAGVLAPDAIDRHVPGAELAASLADERRRLLDTVLAALGTAT